MANDSSSGSALFTAFLLGAVAGAAIALLYAPAAGEETRRKLAEKAREGRKRAESMMRDGQEAFKRQRENLGQAFERGREVFEQARKESL
jgi:gas vesicle protein